MILRIFLGGLLAVSVVRAQSPGPDNQDQAALIALENEWLANLHNPAVLEKILASDFVHPLPTGDFVTKAQHIQFSSTHLPPPNRKQRFDQMQVRVYGDVGVVNGIVLTTDEQSREVERTIFTDVFVRRNGRWEAVILRRKKPLAYDRRTHAGPSRLFKAFDHSPTSIPLRLKTRRGELGDKPRSGRPEEIP